MEENLCGIPEGKTALAEKIALRNYKLRRPFRMGSEIPAHALSAQDTLRVRGSARILAIKTARYGRSSSLTALNLSPIPVPGVACRTIPSARTCPSRTRKLRLTEVLSAVRLGVSINKPPKLIF